jgi:hypothetical protein
VGPRLGFAYAPDWGVLSGGNGEHKLSIRGGFGIYYNRSEEETSLNNLGAPPFGLSSSGAPDYGASKPGFANPFQDLTTGQTFTNKFPAVFAKPGQAVDFSPFEPFSLSQYGPNFRSPYAENYNLTIERELPGNLIARLSYVGALGRRNQTYYEGNPVTQAGHDACLADATCIANRDTQSVLYASHTAYGVDSGGINLFPSQGLIVTEGSSNYNALQLSGIKGATHGLLFQASYTYSHALDTASNYENAGYGGAVRGYNQYQPSLNYGDSAYDARHRFVFAPVYSIPFRKGGSRLTNTLLSGWGVSGILTLATGFPYDISYGGGESYSLWCSASYSYYACPDIPNQVAPLKRINPRADNGVANWFSPDSFVDETIGSFGNIHRNPYHGPGKLNTDAVLSKNLPYMNDETHIMQLRLESYNVFNHTQFNLPDGNFDDGTFGQITGAAAGRQTQLAVKFYF